MLLNNTFTIWHRSKGLFLGSRQNCFDVKSRVLSKQNHAVFLFLVRFLLFSSQQFNSLTKKLSGFPVVIEVDVHNRVIKIVKFEFDLIVMIRGGLGLDFQG